MYEIIFYYIMEYKMSLSKQQTLAVNHFVSTNKTDNTSSKYFYIQNTGKASSFNIK